MKLYPEKGAEMSVWGLHLVLPWLFSAVAASLVLFVFFILSIYLPTLWIQLIGDDGSFQGVFPFGLCQPLTRTSLVFVFLALTTYWGLGFFFFKLRMEEWSGWKPLLTRLPLTLAIAGLFFVIPMLVTIWALAAKTGNIHFDAWGTYEGNHGPWRHVYDLRKLVSRTLLLPLCSFVFGFLSLLIKPTRLGAIVLIATIIISFCLFNSHYWLID